MVEALGGSNTASYEATTVCTNVNNFQTGDFGASFTVPNTPIGIACTITNRAVPAQLVLSKDWVNGAAGDTAGLTITNVANPNDTDSAVATVPAGGVRSTDSAELTIIPGETVTLSETLPAITHTNTGTYDPTSLLCDGQPVDFTVTGSGATATFTVPSSAPVSCVYTNTRQSATVVLQKHWDNAATGDTADLSITGGVTDPATATSTVTAATGSTFTDTTNQATTAVHTGDQVTVTEALGPGNTGSYDTTLACDNGVTPNADGTFTVTADLANTTVTCTLTNTRTAGTLTLQKIWANGAAGDTADLTITGAASSTDNTSTVPNPAPLLFDDTDHPADAQIQSGQVITVAEALGTANTGSYDSELVCDNGATSTHLGHLHRRRQPPHHHLHRHQHPAERHRGAAEALEQRPPPGDTAHFSIAGGARTRRHRHLHGHHRDRVERSPTPPTRPPPRSAPETRSPLTRTCRPPTPAATTPP